MSLKCKLFGHDIRYTQYWNDDGEVIFVRRYCKYCSDVSKLWEVRSYTKASMIKDSFNYKFEKRKKRKRNNVIDLIKCIVTLFNLLFIGVRGLAAYACIAIHFDYGKSSTGTFLGLLLSGILVLGIACVWFYMYACVMRKIEQKVPLDLQKDTISPNEFYESVMIRRGILCFVRLKIASLLGVISTRIFGNVVDARMEK